MGMRVHVVKQSTKYGSDGFNRKGQDFKDFLDALGCDTSGEDYSEKFDCELGKYENALTILKLYKDKRENDELNSMLEDVDYSFDELEDDVEELGGIDYVLETMQDYYDTRDKDNDYIEFEIW